jgi:RimJ/RimL family protein N-acetyltransferase
VTAVSLEDRRVWDDVAIRPLAIADAEALSLLRADPDVRRWSDPEELTPLQARAEIEALGRAWADGKMFGFAIANDEDDALLGALSLTTYGPFRASVGYDLLPTARGRGIATRAVRLAADWAFEHFPELVRLELWTAVGNERSERVAERAGFIREGVLRSRLPFGDELRDVTVFSLLRAERGAVASS